LAVIVGRWGKYMGKLAGKISLVLVAIAALDLQRPRVCIEGAYVFITGRREPERAAAVKEIGRNVSGVRTAIAGHVDWR
jgi:hypothetical protein